MPKHPIVAAIFVSVGFFLVYLALTGFQGLPLAQVNETTTIGITNSPLILVGVGVVLAIVGLYQLLRKTE
jgi:hypothetical protein